MKKTKKNIHFFYPQTTYETGQQTASRLILEHLQDQWRFCPHNIPTLSRSQKVTFFSAVSYILKIFCFWTYLSSFIFKSGIILYFNIGQSWNSIIRDGLAILFVKSFCKRKPLVVSLHGNWFTQWPQQTQKSKIFLKILSAANIVTVLDGSQKQHLVNCRLSENKIKIIPNTCQIPPISFESIEQKHLNNNKLKILYLSNLIESKGYRHFLSMLELLSTARLQKDVNITICGNLITTGYSKSSTDTPEKIEKSVKKLNKPTFEVKWIKSAVGLDKIKLFQESHIFVFPSRIEAQPIVLLEAMASGSAIITSRVGLIPSMIDESSGILLKDIDTHEIFNQTKFLIGNDESRINMAKKALEKFNECFSISAYSQNWNNIFAELNS